MVPCFDEFYGVALGLIPRDREEKFRVLDLGSGTGLLSAMVASSFPRADISLIDLSEEMLNLARERLMDDPDERFQFHLADYSREPLPGEYEAVVSAVSIHHLEDENKRRVFEEAHRVLTPGGVFINADQALGKTPEIEAKYHETWLRQARERGASEEDISAALRRMETDKCSTLKAQLGWLEEAGFAAVDRRYKNHRFAVYSGRKEDA